MVSPCGELAGSSRWAVFTDAWKSGPSSRGLVGLSAAGGAGSPAWKDYHRDTLIGRKCIKDLKIKCVPSYTATCYLFVEMVIRLCHQAAIAGGGITSTHTSCGKRTTGD